MKLLIISHTPHFKNKANQIVFGWGPTIREINHLKKLFDSITHIAPLHSEEVPNTAKPYEEGIRFIPISPFGGESIKKKITVIKSFRETVNYIIKLSSSFDIVHIRLPMGLANLLIPWLNFKGITKVWFKYAGNLDQMNPPVGYWLQRKLLDIFYRTNPVTCNGSKNPLPPNYYHFENPCLEQGDIETGQLYAFNKSFDSKLRILFVGHVADSKGLSRILDMFKFLDNSILNRIESFHVIGDGDIAKYERELKNFNFPFEVIFTGGLEREELNKYYSRSHILLLPSESEGFPKVVAESASFGCIPFVSNVSMISFYINDLNGVLLESLSPQKMSNQFLKLVNDPLGMKTKSKNALKLGPLFTFDRYLNRISNEVIPAVTI